MKKIICILLTLLTVFLFFVSCSDEQPPQVIVIKPEERAPELISGSEKLKTAVDYSNKENWLAFSETTEKKVDVIYFYPEIYFAGENENEICSIDDREMREKAPAYLETQAAVFTDECNLFAPFYRQADRAFLLSLSREDRDLIYEYQAQQDAAAALDYYFAHVNNARPFILAGHDQGSEIVRYVLADYMKDHPDVYKRMVAAYAIGCAVTKPFLNNNSHLRFAKGEADVGVIISYNTEGQGNYGYNDGILIRNLQTLAINPLSWKTDKSYSKPSENLGMLDENGEIVPGVADARINVDRASVMCDNDAALKKYAITGSETELYGPQSYHYHDYDFFFMNLKKNVKTRIDAYFASKA